LPAAADYNALSPRGAREPDGMRTWRGFSPFGGSRQKDLQLHD
jgi:hypothetical protein